MQVVHVVGNRPAPHALAALRANAEVVELAAESASESRNVIRRAMTAGATRIVVMGGDGIVHDAVQELAGTTVALGIIPAGTGNDTACALGLPLDDGSAAATAALADPVPIDAIRTNHGWVISVATSGFSARVNERANAMRWPKGGARYTLATLALLPTLKADRIRLGLDDTEQTIDATLIAVANTRFFGGAMAICPDADPTDGLLDVAVVARLGRLRLLRFFPTVYKGDHRANPSVTFHRAAKVTLSGGGPVRADGELLGPMPVTLEAVPGALYVAGAQTRSAVQ